MKFDKQLSAILEDDVAGHMHPAIIITVRDVEIKADHARWMKGYHGNIFLAVGIGPGVVKGRRSYWRSRAILDKARDFFAPPLRTRLRDWDGSETDWIEPDDNGTFDARTEKIYRQKFAKILTIRKENIRSLKWLDQ